MHPDWLLPAKCANNLHMQWKGRQPLSTSRYVRDFHLMIVYHRREVIRWQTIGFQDDIIIEIFIFCDNIAAYMIMCNCRSLIGHLESDHVLLTCGNTASCIRRIQYTTSTIITDSVYFSRFLFFAHLVESLGRTETWISMSHINKHLSMMLISLTPFCLPVRSILPTMKRTLIWSHAKPV